MKLSLPPVVHHKCNTGFISVMLNKCLVFSFYDLNNFHVVFFLIEKKQRSKMNISQQNS